MPPPLEEIERFKKFAIPFGFLESDFVPSVTSITPNRLLAKIRDPQGKYIAQYWASLDIGLIMFSISEASIEQDKEQGIRSKKNIIWVDFWTGFSLSDPDYLRLDICQMPKLMYLDFCKILSIDSDSNSLRIVHRDKEAFAVLQGFVRERIERVRLGTFAVTDYVPGVGRQEISSPTR